MSRRRSGTSEAQPFELRVIPRKEADYGVALYQRPVSAGRNGVPESRCVVRVWGLPFRSVTDFLLEVLRKSGYHATDLSRQRKAPFLLGEEVGVRLAVLFLAVKPLRKLARIEDIAEAVRGMSVEEAYYWFSQCAGDSPRRAQRALRILLSEE